MWVGGIALDTGRLLMALGKKGFLFGEIVVYKIYALALRGNYKCLLILGASFEGLFYLALIL
jgi:hypothetical protein